MVWEIVKLIGTVVIILVLLELLDLPEWISNRIKGGTSREEINEELNSLKERVKKLEEKLK